MTRRERKLACLQNIANHYGSFGVYDITIHPRKLSIELKCKKPQKGEPTK